MTQLAANTDALQGFIVGTLDDAQLRAFEDQLLRDPSLVQALEESLQLREGLEILRARKQLVTRGPLPRFRQPLKFLVAVAAAIILAVGITLLYRQSRPTIVAASPDTLHLGAVKPKRYVFAKLRAAAAIPVLELPERGALELRALTAATAGASFRVALEQVRGGSTVLLGTVKHIPADASGFVGVYADASALQTGNYVLSVVPDDANISPKDDNTGGRFMFRLQRSAQ